LRTFFASASFFVAIFSPGPVQHLTTTIVSANVGNFRIKTRKHFTCRDHHQQSINLSSAAVLISEQ